MKLLTFLPIIFLTSCQVYQSNFDCPPGKGIPCTSVSDIEKMIVETDKGPDFLLERKNDCCPAESKNCCSVTPSLSNKRIWVETYEDEGGNIVEGHYIYLKEKAK